MENLHFAKPVRFSTFNKLFIWRFCLCSSVPLSLFVLQFPIFPKKNPDGGGEFSGVIRVDSCLIRQCVMHVPTSYPPGLLN